MNKIVEFKFVTTEHYDYSVLNSISFDICSKEFIAVVGADNSGEQQIFRILNSDIQCAKGIVLLEGKEYSPENMLEARRKGVFCISNTPAIQDNTSIAENFFLNTGNQPLLSVVHDKNYIYETQEILKEFDLPFNSTELVSSFSDDVKCILTMIKYHAMGAKLIVLMNVMRSSTNEEKVLFLKVVQKIIDSGASVMLLTNHTSDILMHAKRVLLLSREGRIAKTYYQDSYNKNEIESYLLNSKRMVLARITDCSTNEILMEIDDNGFFGDKSGLIIHRGEIVSVLNRHIGEYGQLSDYNNGLKMIRGSIHTDNGVKNIRNEQDAIQAGIGIMPDDIKKIYCPDLSVVENVVMQFFNNDRLSRIFCIDKYLTALRQDIDKCFEEIKNEFGYSEADDNIYSVIIRFLLYPYKLIIMNQPERYNDIRKVSMIHWMMNQLVERGCAFIVIAGRNDVLDNFSSVKSKRIIL